ncbi:Sh3 And Multiple Ankyrin Repeat Domains Protein 2 [Manis pentadactyla]|nr:Sh3 And Multiple Ankyrin Repeat Domains Protein 2 [Manis pentadactyla]
MLEKEHSVAGSIQTLLLRTAAQLTSDLGQQRIALPPAQCAGSGICQEKREVLLPDQGTKIQERSHALGTGARPVEPPRRPGRLGSGGGGAYTPGPGGPRRCSGRRSQKGGVSICSRVDVVGAFAEDPGELD